MNLWALFRARTAASLRDAQSILFLLLALLIGLGAAAYTHARSEDQLRVGLVNNDAGEYGALLAESLEEEDYLRIEYLEESRAGLLLNQDRLDAVLVIRENFTEKLLKGRFDNVIDLQSSPSSQAAITVSEPVINTTISLWVEEFALLTAADFLADRGAVFTEEEKETFRDALREIWESGAGITLETVYLDGEPETADTGGDMLSATVRWYAVFCLFYLLVSASWMLDMKNARLRARITQSGTRVWKALASAALAPALLAAAGYLLTGVLVCTIFDLPLWEAVRLLPAVLLYLCGALGMTLVFGSLIGDLTTLLFLAPVLTFLSAVLSGMLSALPEWAAVLQMISRVLPGRWLTDYAVGEALPGETLFYALLCAAGWTALGGLISILRERKRG